MSSSYLRGFRDALMIELARQFSRPSRSLSGYLLSRWMQKESRHLERTAVDLLNIRPNDKILEIGYGCGDGLKFAYDKIRNGNGRIFGVEHSYYMHYKSTKRFVLESVDEQRIILEQFDVEHLPFPNALFDGIFHVNSYYFWPNLDNVANELYRIMKPNAQIVAVMDMQRLRRYVDRGLMQFGNIDPIPYLVALELAGFKNVRVEYLADDSNQSKHIQALIGVRGDDDQFESAEDNMAALQLEIMEFYRAEKMKKSQRPAIKTDFITQSDATKRDK